MSEMPAPDEQTEAGVRMQLVAENHAFINGARGSEELRRAGVNALRAAGWLSPAEVAVLRAGWERTAAAEQRERDATIAFHIDPRSGIAHAITSGLKTSFGSDEAPSKWGFVNLSAEGKRLVAKRKADRAARIAAILAAREETT